MTTFRAALMAARRTLESAGIEKAAFDARLLLADAAGLDMAALIGRDREELPDLAEARLHTHLKRRSQGEPVARILGQREFWGLPLLVNAATLVPRPETETLVEAVLAEVCARKDAAVAVHICDLGAGSGAILLALLSELPEARGTATDISAEALEIARRNAERLGLAARISFYEGDFAEGPGGPFDVVVSNPPYIQSAAIEALAPDVRDYDPPAALDGGEDGLACYRAILARSDALVGGDGFLALEVGHDQGETVAAMCRAQGFRAVAIRPDLAGIGRVVIARARALSSS